MDIDKEIFDNMSYEEKEQLRKGGNMLMSLMASMGDKDAILSLEIIKLCEKLRDINIKALRKDDETKNSIINLTKQIHQIIEDFEKEMEK